VDVSGKFIEQGKVSKIIKRYGMEQIEIPRACAGDIVSIAGFNISTVA